MATVAISGSIAQRPGRAGHAWVFLSYLLGFRGLGFEVLFLDRLDAGMVDADEWAAGARSSRGARWLVETMRAAGLEDAYCLLLGDGLETVGVSRGEALARLAGAELLLDFNGFLGDEELLAAAARRVYVDIDPGFAQMWDDLGLADPFAGYDDFVTVGVNVGAEGCAVPTGGRRWIPTRQPVVLERWPRAAPGRAFTSVGSWRGPFEPVEHGGRSYGLRVHEFRRFAELPGLVDAPFELALDIDDEDAADRGLLREGRWELADPEGVAGDLDSYRSYVQGSMAEIAIAKEMYVATRGGWFSDRSASYLASGKPVLAQDTGFGDSLPSGEGLLAFSNLEEARTGAEEISRDLPRHSAAARAIAEEFFASERVLAELLEALDAG
jgi:glycosyltransferase involved in cell wall biosynthesis